MCHGNTGTERDEKEERKGIERGIRRERGRKEDASRGRRGGVTVNIYFVARLTVQ